MRVDAVHDHLVERPLKRQLRRLALLQVQVAVDGCEDRRLRRRDELVERLRRRLRATVAVRRERTLREGRRRRLARERRAGVERGAYGRRRGRRRVVVLHREMWRRAEHADD